MTGYLRKALAEPLVGFTLLAGMIFAVWNVWGEPEAELIVITRDRVAALAEEHRLLEGRAPSAEQLEQLVQRHIDEEVLVRSAYALGLNRGDGRVRRQLINKMSFVVEQEPGEPTEADLQAMYLAHPERYQSPAQADLVQVHTGEDAVDAQTVQALASGSLEPSILGRVSQVYGVMDIEIAEAIGAENAAVLAAAAPGSWHGPYSGPQGLLLVKLVERRPQAEFPRDQLQRYLREDWYISQRQALRRQQLDTLRRGYRVEVEAFKPSLQVAGS